MSREIIIEYGKVLTTALQEKKFDNLVEIMGDPFEARARVMGREYSFTEKEKFQQFLSSLPNGIRIDIGEIKVEADGMYHIAAKMGVGMLKIPSTWIIRLDEAQKISFLEIK